MVQADSVAENGKFSTAQSQKTREIKKKKKNYFAFYFFHQ